MQEIKHKLPIYTKREEKVNFVTHLIGAVFAVVGSISLIVLAIINKNVPQLVCIIIYGATLINLFVCSSIYHSTEDEEARRRKQKGDHLSISILVAGSATGIIGGALHSPGGYFVLGFVWLLSITSAVLNTINVKAFRAPTMACYIGAGWAALFVIIPLYQAVGPAVVALLISGGLFYMLGLIFYAIKKEFMHSVWHIFVLFGAVLHFAAITLTIAG